MAQFDTLIQNGTIIDGTRAPRFTGDVGIRDGKVVAVSRTPLDKSDAKQVIDAKGLIVAPGFVDLHTHYDAQIQWDPYCTLSGWHGVTSLVLGNCGFGFAPVKPENRERVMLSMSRVEAIPYDSMKAGIALPRVHVECDYLGAIHYDDLLQFEVTVGKVGHTAFRLEFQVLKNEKTVARGNFVIVAMDTTTNRPVELPKRLATPLRALLVPDGG